MRAAPSHETQADLDEVVRALESAERAERGGGSSVLDRVRVATPCDASWEGMLGDDRVRHCAVCDREVFDLSALTTREAEALLTANGRPPCVRFRRRADGRVITSDCEVGVRAVRAKRRLAVLGSGAALAVGASLALAAVAPDHAVPLKPDAEDQAYIEEMGEEPLLFYQGAPDPPFVDDPMSRKPRRK